LAEVVCLYLVVSADTLRRQTPARIGSSGGPSQGSPDRRLQRRTASGIAHSTKPWKSGSSQFLFPFPAAGAVTSTCTLTVRPRHSVTFKAAIVVAGSGTSASVVSASAAVQR
jgi:hypothetical protein